MGLRTKFNLVMTPVFILGLGISGFFSYQMLQNNAREEVIQNAGIMIEAALAVGNYTVKQVTPHLELQLQRVFLPQSVASFAATETFNAIRSKYPEYAYREAALNPTHPRNRAEDWEASIVQTFRANAETTEIIGERETPNGRTLYLARPIQIKDPACLACHSTPEKAPPSMIKLYGTAHGFGWKLHETIGAQIVTMPMSLPMRKARKAFYTVIGSLAGIFIAIFATLNIMLHFIIIHPLSHMACVADAISTGNLTLHDLPINGNDEVSTLAKSFNRLRRSVEKALKMIEE